MSYPSSRLSGFTEGYKASNIAYSSSSIKLHLKEIIGTFQLFEENNYSSEIIDFANKSLIVINNNNDYLSIMIEFGELIKSNLAMLKDEGTNPRQYINKIVYHFLEIAELIEDKKLNAIAIEIGSFFSGE